MMNTYASLQEIRDRGVTTDQATDPEVEIALVRATLQVEAFCGRDFWMHARTFSVDGNGKETLFLNDWPIIQVENLWVDDVLVDPDSYRVYGEEGYIRLYSGIRFPWAAVAGVFPEGALNVTVKGDFGFEEVPEAVKEACIILALKAIKGLRYEAGSSESAIGAGAEIRRVKVDDIAVDFDTPGKTDRRRELLGSTGDVKADRLLSRYRVKVHATAV